MGIVIVAFSCQVAFEFLTYSFSTFGSPLLFLIYSHQASTATEEAETKPVKEVRYNSFLRPTVSWIVVLRASE